MNKNITRSKNWLPIALSDKQQHLYMASNSANGIYTLIPAKLIGIKNMMYLNIYFYHSG